MGSKRCTPEGLPIVLQEVIEIHRRDIHVRSLSSEGGHEILEEAREAMKKDNSALHALMENISQTMPIICPDVLEEAGLSVESGYLVAYEAGFEDCYRLLMTQARIDKQERDYE